MTPIKYLFWLIETSFYWLWQSLISTSDELNLAQGSRHLDLLVLSDS